MVIGLLESFCSVIIPFSVSGFCAHKIGRESMMPRLIHSEALLMLMLVYLEAKINDLDKRARK